jgi:predicted alpha/beta-fold hydrolase
MIKIRTRWSKPSSPDRGAEFRPLPLLSNPHLQTLIGFLLRGPAFAHPSREQVLWLPDGDGLMLHDSVPPGWRPGDRIVLLVHGLGGSHGTPLLCRLATALLGGGLRVVRMDLRGAGHGLPLARRCYHAGRSDDARAVLEEIHRWYPESPLTLVGVSLGGNLVLKLAGEAADRPVPGLNRVFSLNPPIDLERCAALLAKRRNRLYERYFLRELLAEVQLRRGHFPDLPDPCFPRRLTMRHFDDLYTAPNWGFADAMDYYHSASALPFIGRITLPTLILTARDDPFIAVEPFEALAPPPNVVVRILPHGGHLGFVGWDGVGGIRWAERRLVEWVLQPESWQN